MLSPLAQFILNCLLFDTTSLNVDLFNKPKAQTQVTHLDIKQNSFWSAVMASLKPRELEKSRERYHVPDL